MRSAFVLALLIAGQQQNSYRPEKAPCGRYEAVACRASCNLEVHPRRTYRLRCRDQTMSEGHVGFGLPGSAVVLLFPALQESPRIAANAEAEAYRAAVATFIEEHYRRHGFFPLVAPTSLPPPTPAQPARRMEALVAVRLSEHLYLVAFTGRDRLCAPAKEGREPDLEPNPWLFKREEPAEEGVGLPS